MDPSFSYPSNFDMELAFENDGHPAGTTPLKPAEPLNLADPPLKLTGYPFKSPSGSERTIRTHPPGDLPERTAYTVEDPSCLVLGAEFHD